MSRIGKAPIPLPKEVTVEIVGDEIHVKGPKGTLTKSIPHGISVIKEDGHLVIQRADDNGLRRSLHGLVRNLIYNMVKGVCEPFAKTLVLTGVGYRAQKQGEKLMLQLGFSHNVDIPSPKGIAVDVQGTNKIIIKGIDKEIVGQFAASVRRLREVEPYKGKGIRYEDEHVRRKAGKAGKVGAKAA